MNRFLALFLIVALTGLVALPGVAQASEDAAAPQLQQKNHEETEPHFDGNGGINRHQTTGDHGPNGEEYGNYSDADPKIGTLELIWIAMTRWIVNLPATR